MAWNGKATLDTVNSIGQAFLAMVDPEQRSRAAKELAERSKGAVAKAVAAADAKQHLDDVADLWAKGEVGNIARRMHLSEQEVKAVTSHAQKMGQKVLQSYDDLYAHPEQAFVSGAKQDISKAFAAKNSAVADLAKEAVEEQLKALKLPPVDEAIGKLNALSGPDQRTFMQSLIGKMQDPNAILSPNESSLALSIAYARTGWGVSQSSRATIGQLATQKSMSGVLEVAAKEIGRVDPAVRQAYNFYDELLVEFTKKGTAVEEVMKDLSVLGAKFEAPGSVPASNYAGVPKP